MIPEPTTAASKNAVPVNSATTGRSVTVRRSRGVARFRFFVHDVGFPAAAVRIARPHFGLLRVAARLVAFDVHRVTRALQPRDLRIDGIRRIDDDAEVLAAPRLRGGIQIERQF